MIKSLLTNIKKEKIRKERRKTAKKIALGAVSGIAAGVAGGILLAPKSGKETCKDISEAASEINCKIKETATATKDNIQNKSKELKSNVAEAREKISNYLSEKKSQLVKDETCTCCEEVSEKKEINEEVTPDSSSEDN